MDLFLIAANIFTLYTPIMDIKFGNVFTNSTNSRLYAIRSCFLLPGGFSIDSSSSRENRCRRYRTARATENSMYRFANVCHPFAKLFRNCRVYVSRINAKTCKFSHFRFNKIIYTLSSFLSFVAIRICKFRPKPSV